MTTITYLDAHRMHGARSSTRLPETRPSLLAKLAIAWQRRKTERMLEGLPQEIRKDIGWPTTISK